MILFCQIVIPLVFIAATSLFVRRQVYTRKRAAIQFFATITLLSAIAWVQMVRYYNDSEVISGTVTGKATERAECEHKGAHKYDIDWAVYFSTGEHVRIKREDLAGYSAPLRWHMTAVGEPASFLQHYANHIKGYPEQLFRYDDKAVVAKYAKYLPEYPRTIYDYYRVRRFVPVNYQVPNLKKNPLAHAKWLAWISEWNDLISQLNGYIGSDKSANVIVVLVQNLPKDFASALRTHWRDGKKNDIVVTIGVDGEYRIAWASVVAYAQDPNFVKILRNAIQNHKKAEAEKIVETITETVKKSFKRRIYTEIEYIAMTMIPSKTLFVLTMFMNILLNGLMVRYYMGQPGPRRVS
jgi:hypothetical protein